MNIRLLGAARHTDKGPDCAITVTLTEAGTMECHADVPLADKEAFVAVLDYAHANPDYRRRLDYVPATDGAADRYTVIISFTLLDDLCGPINLANLLLWCKRQLRGYDFDEPNLWFEITDATTPGLSPVIAHLRVGGSDDLHIFEIMLSLEHIGSAPAQLAPGWQAELMRAVRESTKAGDYRLSIRLGGDYNTVLPGYDPDSVYVRCTQGGVDPLERILSLLAFMPPQNGAS